MKYSKLYYDQIKSKVNNFSKEFEEIDSISFLRLAAFLLFKVEPRNLDDNITDDYDDLGADCIYFDIDNDNNSFDMYILQSKYNKTNCEKENWNSLIGEEVINKFKNIFDYFSTQVGDNMEYVNSEVKMKRQEYDDLTEKLSLNNVYCIVTHLGTDISDRSQEIWNRWVNQHPHKDHIHLKNFNLEKIYKKLEETKIQNNSGLIQLDGQFLKYKNDEIKSIISTISGNELVKLYEEFGLTLFKQNIRYLLKKSKINEKITETIEDYDERSNFWFLNNGITIVCENFEQLNKLSKEDVKLKLTNFSIVNGAQTTSSIYNSSKVIGNLTDLKVMIKIFKADKEMSEKITESTNSQNKIDDRDLHSNDEIQKLFELNLFNENYFYQRKREQFTSEINRHKVIDNLDFAQCYHAFYLENPSKARNSKISHFSNSELYKKIFDVRVLTVDKIIITFESFNKLLLGIRNIKKKIKNDNLRVSENFKEHFDRSKFHIFVGIKKYLEIMEEIDFDSPRQNIDFDLFSNEDLIIKLMNLIILSLNEIKETEYIQIKLFQKPELYLKLIEKISSLKTD